MNAFCQVFLVLKKEFQQIICKLFSPKKMSKFILLLNIFYIQLYN